MTGSSPPIVLTIAGFDPSSGAGVTADLKTLAAYGVYGVACITAMTVQSTLGVREVAFQSPQWIRQTLACLADDVTLAGIKIGMLGSSGAVDEVSSFLAGLPAGSSAIVLDPIVRSSSGTPLIDPDGLVALREQLLGQAGWITPNLDELSLLTGEGPMETPDQVAAGAHKLQRLAAGCGNDQLNVVVTGGHLQRPDDFLLTASGEETWLTGERVETNATHGTGCAFSSALVCGLVAGKTPRTAVANAKSFVTKALRAAYPIGRGKGPMNHLFSLRLNSE